VHSRKIKNQNSNIKSNHGFHRFNRGFHGFFCVIRVICGCVIRVICGFILIFESGCAEQIQKPRRVCPGKETVAESLSVLMSRSQSAVPLKANGQCCLLYYVEGKKHEENFPVKVWVNPPAEICLQGDVAFDPRGIVLGSNENEFWLAIRLKEISSYWQGRWEQINYLDELMISPRLVLEGLGIIAVGSDGNGDQNWSLSKKEAFDVLTRHEAGNDKVGIIKKIYIYDCDYLVRKIEYFNVNRQAQIIVELDKYEQVVEEFFVPRSIKITKYGESVEDLTSITFSLTSVKSDSFSVKQRNFLFTHPEPKGFKHVFVNVDGNWIEQKQD